MSSSSARDAQIDRLAKRFGMRCWYCGIKLNSYATITHIDHIIPRGSHLPNVDCERNLALACNFCNYAKFDHTLDTFLSWLAWVRSPESFTPFNYSMEDLYEIVRKEMPELPKEIFAKT